MIHIHKTKIVLFFALLGLLSVAPITTSFAQNVCQILNPAAGAPVLPWLAARTKAGCGPRDHLGVDIMLDMCMPVQNQAGCHIVMNGSTPLFDGGVSTNSGYGYYTRYKCNDNVEVRYAHLNAYDGIAQMAINGRSGAAKTTPPHVHYDVLVSIGGSAPQWVDPECVWGNHPNPSVCCIGSNPLCGLGTRPADMCNPADLQNLVANFVRASRPCTDQNGSSMPITNGIPPDQVPPAIYGVDEPGCPAVPAAPPGTPPPVMGDEGEDTGVAGVPTNPPIYPGGTITFPPDPNGTEPIGTPGAEAILTPTTTATSAVLSGCATDTWTSMVNQAVLEARRENIINQRLIAKADSVITYSCFDRLVQNTGTIAGPIFSESNAWANKTIDIIGKTVTINVNLGSSSLDGALTNTVNQVASQYLSNNFNHGLLGETATVAAPTGGAGNCDVMATVWQAGKCNNLGLPFYTFQNLISMDPRNVPASLNCSP